MKLTSSLSTVALVLLVNTAPSFALNQSSQNLSNQPLSSQGETIKVAGLFETINKTIDTIEREEKRRSRARERKLRQQRAAERRRASELRAAERRRAAELRQQQVQQRAIARQRQQEAERQRFAKWWESLSPQEKQAYIARERAREQRAARVLTTIIGPMLIESMMNPGSGGSSVNSGYTHRYENRKTGGYRPAPRPVPAVGGPGSIHGGGPGHGTRTPR